MGCKCGNLDVVEEISRKLKLETDENENGEVEDSFILIKSTDKPLKGNRKLLHEKLLRKIKLDSNNNFIR